MITEIDWNFIISTIKNEKCILFIGPELLKDEQGNTVENQLAKFLKVKTNPDILNFYEKDGLFLFTNGTKKTTSYYKIKEFYSQSFSNSETILKELAKIPFHFIISITPDKKCHETFESLGFKSNFKFYWKNQKTDHSIGKPTIKKPIIYNMFGSIDSQDSMILTHDDLFDYFESIFKESSMPEKLKINLKEADNFIFLGLDFEKWYMQLLLRILYLHNDKYEFMRYAANQTVNEDLKSFCFQQFKIEFIPTQIKEFVSELVTQCENVGIIREVEKEQSSLIDLYKKWLSQDKIDEVLNGIREFFEGLGDMGKELIDDIDLITNRYRRLNRKINSGIMDTRDIEVESNKIRVALIELLNEAKELE